MSKQIKPSDVSAQVDFEIGDAIAFCADLLEDVNAHNVSYVLAAINAGEYDLACEFIKLEQAQDEAGELTKELRQTRDELIEKLDHATLDDEDHECDDDCREFGCSRK